MLKHPEDGDNLKMFTFDRVYWSHDGFTEANNGLLVPEPHHPNGEIYVDQVGIQTNL